MSQEVKDTEDMVFSTRDFHKINESSVLAGFKVINKRYLFLYFFLICSGLLNYSILSNLLKIINPTKIDDEPILKHHIPFYAGLVLSALKILPKRIRSFIFNLVFCIAIVILLIGYKRSDMFDAGKIIINFAGGYFEGITSIYFFEVSPKEVFALAGTMGYLSTVGGDLIVVILVYFSRMISKDLYIEITLCYAMLFGLGNVIILFYTGNTPVELCLAGSFNQCYLELKKMYANQDDARDRFEDIMQVIKHTDKYKTSVFKMALFPQKYRKALLIGIGICCGQGVIMTFFENVVCSMSKDSETKLACQRELYDLDEGLLKMIFFYILIVGPILLFIIKLEIYGRAKLFFIGTIATLIYAFAIQILQFIEQGASSNKLNAVFQGLSNFYTIFIYSAILGPTYMVYLPEILPLSGVTISIAARNAAKIAANFFLIFGIYNPAIFIAILILYAIFVHLMLKETRWLTDIQLFNLYLESEQKAKLDIFITN